MNWSAKLPYDLFSSDLVATILSGAFLIPEDAEAAALAGPCTTFFKALALYTAELL